MGDEGRTSGSAYSIAWFYLGPFIAASATALRLYVRITKVGWKKLAIDDFLVSLSTCFLIVQCAIGLVCLIPNGLGKPVDTLSAETFSKYIKSQYILLYVYIFSANTPKIAILAYYYRIFVVKIFRRIVIGTIIYISLGSLAILISLILLCRPVERVWNVAMPGKCFNFRLFVFIINILHMSLNAWIFLLPIPIIARLQLTRSRKLALGSIFLVGQSTLAIGIVRIVYSSSEAEDRTARGIYLAFLAVLEPLLHILCCNLPVIFYLFVHGVRQIKPVLGTRPCFCWPSSRHPFKISSVSSPSSLPSLSKPSSNCKPAVLTFGRKGHRRLKSDTSVESFRNDSCNNSTRNKDRKKNPQKNSNDADYWLRLCNSHVVNDMAPETVIYAGGSDAANEAIHDKNSKDAFMIVRSGDNDSVGGSFGDGAGNDGYNDDNFAEKGVVTRSYSTNNRKDKRKAARGNDNDENPVNGIVVKQEIVRSVSYRERK